MDKDFKEGKRRPKRGKVGVSNDGYEMEEASETVKNKVSPFLNNIREAQTKSKLNVKANALEALIGAKVSVSKWRDLVNRKRIKKKNTQASGEETKERGGIGGLGLDDIHEDFVRGQEKIFGTKSGKTMSVASNQALLQYFSKLGKSTKDNELIDLDFVETLLKSGADVNCTDKHGQTLLHEVSIKWHTDVAKFLLDLGADINKADNYGRTPLHVAAADDYPEMVELLIDRGADRQAKTAGELQTPMHYAARNDASSALKMLVKKRCEYKQVKDYKGRTPLHVAAELDRSETARLLLELEAPAGLSDRHGETIITWMITKMPPVAFLKDVSKANRKPPDEIAPIGALLSWFVLFAGMIKVMLNTAAEALEQFHIRDRPNRKQHFYLNLLVQDRIKDPELNTKTPLVVAVRYKQFDIVTHPVFLTLLKIMWTKFGRWRAYGAILFNLIYILLWTVFGVTIEYDKRSTYDFPEHTWRIILLICAVGITIWNIVEEIREYGRSKSMLDKYKEWRKKEIEDDLRYCHPRWPEEKNFLDTELENLNNSNTRYFTDYWNIFDWITYLMLMAVVGTHIADIIKPSDRLAQSHIRLTCVAIIFLWLRLMKNIRAFSTLGPFVVMLGAMFTDLLKFGFLYMEFLIPYVCGFWMLFGGTKYPEGTASDTNRTEISVPGFHNFNDALFTMFRLTLVDEYAYDDMKEVDSLMTDIMIGTWLAISAVLCLNLLIALFSDTFQRVYDNAQANAVMQKAMLVLSFWDGMSSEARNKFLDYVSKNCSPFSEYYDDDMTEGGESDLKKVTIQIKEQLDSLMEKWHDQFGEDEGQTYLEELQEEERQASSNEKHGKMVTTQKFDTEIEQLRDEVRDGLKHLQQQQNQMMSKFKQDMKLVKSLLIDLTNNGSAGGGGPGSRTGSLMLRQGLMEEEEQYSVADSAVRPKSGKKKKRAKSSLEQLPDVGSSLPGEILMTQHSDAMFAATPPAGPGVLDVAEQEVIHFDPFQVDTFPSARSSLQGPDSQA